MSWPQITLYQAAAYAAEVFALLVASTAVFDVVHFTLHRMARMRHPLPRALGGLHQAHHDFLTTDLRFVDAQVHANLFKHVVPEFLTRVSVTSLGFLIFDWIPVAITIAIATVQLVIVIVGRGRDSNHVAPERLSSPQSGVFVGPAYHSLHHIFPEAYFSSFTTLFDRLFGTALDMRGRRVVMTGASGAFGAPLKAILERAGASVRTLKFGVDYTYDDYAKAEAALAECDVLVLCHGSKVDAAQAANCDSFVALIERFRALHRGRRFPIEVWATGSEIESHPAWGNRDLQIYSASKRNYARHARRYFCDETFIYRHIVASAFTSRMGPGLISGDTAARMAWFWLRRGLRYVPVTYTGIAFVNFFKFWLRLGWAPALDPAARDGSPKLG